MNANGKPGEIEDEHQPAIGVRLIGVVFPFENKPEDQSGEHGGVGIDLTFHGREPECVAPSVGERTGQTATHDDNQLGEGGDDAVFANEFPRQVCDAPEEEENAKGGKQCRHDVHAERHLGRVVCELSEEVAGQHEERCAGRVTHFKFIGCGDELRTVPKTCGRFHRQAVGHGCHGKREPAQQVVD